MIANTYKNSYELKRDTDNLPTFYVEVGEFDKDSGGYERYLVSEETLQKIHQLLKTQTS